ncbi:MAG TPA: enoyl-CoA hydratase/isomerase family protein, partial [Streptosporangiaceae bacterium]
MTDSVLREQTGTVATITINRPAARNALTAETKLGLLDALRDCSGDDGVRAVVLTGAGRAFCAGQDLREHAEQLEAGGAVSDTVREYYNPMVAAITAMPKPVIAAINGV